MIKVDVNHDCKTELNDVELRATPARIAVIKLLENTEQPIDVAMIKNHLDKEHVDTDPATVFRIVNMFQVKGLVKQISFNEGKFRYELASKPDHHHLICNTCGKVEDFSDCPLPQIKEKVQKTQSFLVKQHKLEFFGLCKYCQKIQN